jgi:hypothetical protein
MRVPVGCSHTDDPSHFQPAPSLRARLAEPASTDKPAGRPGCDWLLLFVSIFCLRLGVVAGCLIRIVRQRMQGGVYGHSDSLDRVKGTANVHQRFAQAFDFRLQPDVRVFLVFKAFLIRVPLHSQFRDLRVDLRKLAFDFAAGSL